MLRRGPRARRIQWLTGLVIGVVLLVAIVAGYLVIRPAADPSGSAGPEPSHVAAPANPAPADLSSPDLFVSPDGDGSCTADGPCSLPDALEKATGTDVIELLSGDYGELKIRPTRATRSGSGVVVTAAPGADVQIARLDIYPSNLTWLGLTVKGVVYLYGSATNTVLDGITVDGGGLFVRSDDTVVRNSLFENGSSLDGIQIGGAHRVRIESNVVRDYNQNGTAIYHSDCVQVFDSGDITITNNRLSNCSNAGIIFSGGGGKGITNITVESNFIRGCVVKNNACRGGSAMDIREPSATGAVVRNNTIMSGSARVGLQADLVFDRNIVGYLSDCTAPVTNSIIEVWNEGVCKNADNLSAHGNRIQDVPVVDLSSGDLHPVDGETARIDPQGNTQPAPFTIDGTPMPADIAGAAG